MRIAFVDAQGWAYDVDTPLREPLGGSQSALCYLTVELAKRGHDVTIFNGSPEPLTKHGVTCRGGAGIKGDILNSFDFIISLNSADLARMMREAFGVKCPLVLWEHHGWWQPAAALLGKPEIAKHWTGIAFVAETQRAKYKTLYAPLERASSVVMHNGVSPPFEHAELREPSNPPTLFYTSTPFRGLDVLLAGFPTIRKATKARLKVFSSMLVYRAQERPEWSHLYAVASEMDGVDYRPSIGQAELAEELATCTAFAHPSTFPECHSIAAIEAMAVGAAVLTTDLGGQLEATGCMASTIPYDWDNGTHEALVEPYAEMVIAELKEMQRDPKKARLERMERSVFALENYRWKDKAADWEKWLSGLV